MKERPLFNVAGYIRLSREDGDKAESDSIGNQRKLLMDYLKDKPDLILYDLYIDDGFTGIHFNRPSFQRMLADIETGKINCVIVKDLSRFGRDYIDTGKYLERYFPGHDVRFISITDHIDSIKQAYDILLPIKNIFNEQYARDISDKVHAAVRTKQQAGEFIGAFASYGYRKSPADKNKLLIDEYAAGVIRTIFTLFINGCGKNRIARILNGRGIVCPSEYKRINGDNYRNSNRLDSTCYWTYSTINRILQNELYIGNMVQGRKIQHMRGKQHTRDRENWIVVPNTHEAIIDIDTWEKAQSLLKRQTRALDLHSGTGVFAGFLKCGDCGRSLVKKSRTDTHGNSLITYYCGTYVRSGRQYCSPHAVSHELLEGIILDDLNTLIGSLGSLRDIAEQYQTAGTAKPALSTERNRLRTELKRIRKLNQAVYEDYREELISQKEFSAYRQDYLKKEELLTKQLESLEEQPNASAVTDISKLPLIKRLLEAKSVEKINRGIITEMLYEIKVYQNNTIRLTYNFSKIEENRFKSVYPVQFSIEPNTPPQAEGHQI